MNQTQKRILLMDIHDRRAEFVNSIFRPLIKQAIASSDYDRLILLEAQRELRLKRLQAIWIKIDEKIQGDI